MLKDVLDIAPLTLISSHGLVCHTHDGQIHLHPELADSGDVIKRIHSKVDLIRICSRFPALKVEKKMSGVCFNFNSENGMNREKIKKLVYDEFLEMIEESKLRFAVEHGSIEIRPKVGKRDGLLYFKELGLLSWPHYFKI